MCFVFIIAPCSIIKAALFPKLGPPPPSPPYNVASRGTLWAQWPNIVRGGGGGGERWNCQKRPSVPLLLTRIVACELHSCDLKITICKWHSLTTIWWCADGGTGSGKSLSLAHVIHYCVTAGWFILLAPNGKDTVFALHEFASPGMNNRAQNSETNIVEFTIWIIIIIVIIIIIISSSSS